MNSLSKSGGLHYCDLCDRKWTHKDCHVDSSGNTLPCPTCGYVSRGKDPLDLSVWYYEDTDLEAYVANVRMGVYDE